MMSIIQNVICCQDGGGGFGGGQEGQPPLLAKSRGAKLYFCPSI